MKIKHIFANNQLILLVEIRGTTGDTSYINRGFFTTTG